MGDLISRSALIENIDNDIKMTEQFMNSEMDTKRYSQLFAQLNTLKSYKGIIEEMPTAYDVEKVVSEIHKKHCQKCRNILSVAGAEEYCKSVNCDIGIICDIVKRGGVE